jgi:hypothetical protein
MTCSTHIDLKESLTHLLPAATDFTLSVPFVNKIRHQTASTDIRPLFLSRRYSSAFKSSSSWKTVKLLFEVL